MEINGVSTYSKIVTDGLKKDLGMSYLDKVDGGLDRNRNKVLDREDKDGAVQTDEAWEYFFNNYRQGRYKEVMSRLQKEGFEYPFDLDGPEDSDRRLIEWIITTDLMMVLGKGITDEVEKAKEFYLKIIPKELGGKSEEQGGLDIEFNSDPAARPMGSKLSLETFTKRDKNGKRFANCQEYVSLYTAVLRAIGLKAYMVPYQKGDYNLLSSARNREIFKRVEEGLAGEGHVYTYFITKDGREFIVDPVNMVFEELKREGHYWDDRKANAQHYSEEGRIYIQQAKLEEAQEKLKIALEIDPDFANAHNNLGAVYMCQKNIEEATREYEEAIRIDPDFANAHNNLGVVYMRQGKLEEAEVEFFKAVSLNPNLPEPNAGLGDLYKIEGDSEKAVEAYKKAVELFKKFKRSEEAEKYFKKAEELERK